MRDRTPPAYRLSAVWSAATGAWAEPIPRAVPVRAPITISDPGVQALIRWLKGVREADHPPADDGKE